MNSPHTSVLLTEVTRRLAPTPGRFFIDATFGAGGYSRAIIAAGARVLAFDRDPAAQRFAASLEEEGRFHLVTARFSRMVELAGEATADGVAFDLGVSSMQFDGADRGFSLMRDGPLDMRMGGEGRTAADIVNAAPREELARIFRSFGEEPRAGRVAGAIARRRLEAPFERTLDLADVVGRALGGRRGARMHPATRAFQALRIAVNDELGELEAGLAAAERVLKQGGVLAVVTFHSLEDRIVKSFLAARSGASPRGSRHAPPTTPLAGPTFRLVSGGPERPSDAEIAANVRARSAKLRGAVRTSAPPWRLAA